MSCIEHRVRNNLRSLRSRFYVAAVGLAMASGSFLQSGSALDWQAGNGWRSAQLPVSKSGPTGFTLLPPAVTGIGFTNQLSDTNAALNQIRLNGSGVAAGDVDGDGAACRWRWLTWTAMARWTFTSPIIARRPSAALDWTC